MINFKKIKESSPLKIDPRFEKLPFKNLFTVSLAINLIFLGLAFLSSLILPPEIPLFYGLPKNSGQLSASMFIVLPSILSLAITIINAVISVNINLQYLKKVLAFATLIVAILNLIATYKIVTLVGMI